MYGESGTSHTKDIHYYYVCGSRRKKLGPCNMKSVKKQELEDFVMQAITNTLNNEENIQFLTDKIFEYHKHHANDNANLKLLEQREKEINKSCQNMIKAIEQGIITEMTKSRLSELETELENIRIEITKEKHKNNLFLTKEDIDQFLRKQVFEDTSDIKIRKLLVNTFVREIYLYNDAVVILFNYTNNPTPPKFTIEENIETEKQINSALSNPQSSCILPQSAPNKGKTDYEKWNFGRLYRISKSRCIQYTEKIDRNQLSKKTCRIHNEQNLLKMLDSFRLSGKPKGDGTNHL